MIGECEPKVPSSYKTVIGLIQEEFNQKDTDLGKLKNCLERDLNQPLQGEGMVVRATQLIWAIDLKSTATRAHCHLLLGLNRATLLHSPLGCRHGYHQL